MRIFVTGGAGYVGSHCVRRLVAAGHEVTVLDNLSQGHRAAVDPKAAFVQGDLGDTALLESIFGAVRFDAVMHFAALLNVGESVHKPLEYYRGNVANTVILLQAMRTAEIRRIVFSSTCAIYGEPATLPIDESLPTRPINPYGRTKLAIEWMLQDSAPAWGLGSVSLRYFNASGASADGTIGEDHRPELHLIPIILEVALGKRPVIKVYGTDYPTPDGSCVRDYIHVEDLAEAHLKAVESCEPGRADAYNLGSGSAYSVLEVIEAARSVTGHEIPAEIAPRRPGDPPVLCANPQKLMQTLGWRPAYTEIRPIIETAWRWHRSHPDGFGG